MYAQTASSYNALHGAEQSRKAAVIAAYYDDKDLLRKGVTVLDVGCGTGISSKPFVDAGCKVTGIDPCAPLLALAKGITAIQGTAENLPFPDVSFDLVVCVTALHNVQDWRKALSEMKRASKAEVCISLLKRSAVFKEACAEIERIFHVDQAVEDVQDCILFLTVPAFRLQSCRNPCHRRRRIQHRQSMQ
ncbi:class I SAM-dependent methyltransferase [Candidatus Woesearchaeota archaeon]|nr:class I SAM-dependent methyltransferase [Candidatus Woesearchaeota archaeon]